jgi:hypothetical protein
MKKTKTTKQPVVNKPGASNLRRRRQDANKAKGKAT